MTVTEDKALVVDLTKEESAQILPHAPILSSQQVGWSGIFLSHYHHHAHETPEHKLSQHVLAISAVNTQVKQESRLGEKHKSYLFGHGEIEIVPANVSHWSRWDRELEFTLITLCPRFVEQVAHEFVSSERVELIAQYAVVDPLIQQIGLALKAEVESGCMAGHLYGESAATMLTVHLLKQYSTWTPQIPAYTDGLSKHRLQQAIEYINEHLDQNVKLADLATAVGVSQYYFVRLFKQSMGVTPHQYLIQQRVERAKRLLKQKEVAILHIALECGFNSQEHLTKLFRRFTGMTPRAYRHR